jgi:membrane-associated PAP2 superfamily phosphatase
MMKDYDLLPGGLRRKTTEVEVPDPKRHPGHCYPPRHPEDEED